MKKTAVVLLSVYFFVTATGCLSMFLLDDPYYADSGQTNDSSVGGEEQTDTSIDEEAPAEEATTGESPADDAAMEDFMSTITSEDHQESSATDMYETVEEPAVADPAPPAERRHDPNAVVDPTMNSREMWGYYLSMNMTRTNVTFRNPDNHKVNNATYDLVKQEWVFRGPVFDDSRVDLTRFYSSVSLTHDELNNGAGTSVPASSGTTQSTQSTSSPESGSLPSGHVQSGVAASAWVKAMEELERKYGFEVDTNAIVKTDLADQVMWGYKLNQNPSGVYFYINDGRPTSNAIPEAYFSTRGQYWHLKNDGFDSSRIDLTELYESITLTHRQLDRFYPRTEIVLDRNKAPVETASSRRDLEDFIDYISRGGAPASDVAFYREAAGVFGRRGAVVPFDYGSLYGVNDIGMQAGVFIPPEAEGLDAHFTRQNYDLIITGGMQYYFEMHKEEMVLSVQDEKIHAVKDNSSIPVRLIEVVPTDRDSTPGILRGEELRRQVEADLEHAFGKDVTVSLSTERVAYSELEEFFDLKVNKSESTIHKLHQMYGDTYADDAIFIDYFTNMEWLETLDPDYSHPVSTGTYGTDWARKKHTIMHELGHALSLRHHFTKEVPEVYTDIDEHISPACIMNYYYTSNRYCPLCRYALGIEEPYE